MCVFVFFFIMLLNYKNKNKKNKKCMFVFILGIFSRWDGKRIKKDLIFWSDHGVEVQTCTKVVFLNSDEKTKFLKLL
jgi:hypothetical protein